MTNAKEEAVTRSRRGRRALLPPLARLDGGDQHGPFHVSTGLSGEPDAQAQADQRLREIR